MDPNSNVIISTLLSLPGYVLICSQKDSENKLSHPSILTVLGGYPFAALISNPVATCVEINRGKSRFD
jgi:hypothetical protein